MLKNRPASTKLTFILHPSSFIPFLLALLFSLSICISLVNAKEAPKPKLQEWQINGILAALDDGYSGVKTKAFEELVRYDAKDLKAFPKQSEEIGKRAIALVNNSEEDSFLRMRAAGALGSLGKADASAINFLTTLVNNSKENSIFRSRAAYALGSLGKVDTSAVNSLTALVNNSKEDSLLRSSAVEALGNLGRADASVVNSLTTLVNNSKEDSLLRSSAAGALRSLGKANASVINFLTTLFNNSKENVIFRARAVVALGNLGKADTFVVNSLTALVNNSKEDSLLRSEAARALGNLGKADAFVVNSLTTLVNNSKEDFDLRIAAAGALGSLGKADASVVTFLTTQFNNSKKNSIFRRSAVEALGSLSKADVAAVNSLTTLVNNSKEDFDLRRSAVEALGNLSKADVAAVNSLTTLVSNSKEDSGLRSSAAKALGSIKQLNLGELFVLIDRTFGVDLDGVYEMRFSSYFYGRGDSDIKTLMKWIGRPKSLPNPDQLTYDERRKTLEVFKKAWEPSREFSQPRIELARAIAIVASQPGWKIGDSLLLEEHYKNLSAAKFSEADSVKAAIDSLTVWKRIKEFRNVVLIHLAFWLALIFAYPKFPQVQAIFFWNPWVRRILGVGYVGFLLTWVPFLRRTLFEPFKFSLLADAGLDRFNSQAYFPESEVSPLGSTDTFPIRTAISSIKRQIVLEGASGLGKSMFLRHLVNHSKRIVVFLPARKCENGVIEAIQAKLHGQAQDAEFLKNLIYSGAIDICIDGLNEVTADTRAKITQFVESYFKGNIIMTTQPLEWKPPSTAKVYQLHPLRNDQIETFLLSRKNSIAPISNSNIPQNNGRDAISNSNVPSKSENVPSKSGNDPSKSGNTPISNSNDPSKNSNDAIVTSNYPEFCRTYLTQSLHPAQSPEELTATQRILSNPMDLTVVAQMLALGKTPDLFRLQEQQYTLMSADYQHRWNQDFPLKKFAEAVYQLHLNDEKALPAAEFLPELLSMEDEKYKMVVSRQWKDAKGEAQHEWYFRHDKIAEFFIVQTFLGDGEDVKTRLIDRIGDPRFRGVYFLLATTLPLNDANDLRETLIQYAADTKDHTVSDEFVQLLRIRPQQEAIHSES